MEHPQRGLANIGRKFWLVLTERALPLIPSPAEGAASLRVLSLYLITIHSLI